MLPFFCFLVLSFVTRLLAIIISIGTHVSGVENLAALQLMHPSIMADMEGSTSFRS